MGAIRKDCHAVDEIPVLGSGKLDLQAVKQLAVRRDGGGGS